MTLPKQVKPEPAITAAEKLLAAVVAESGGSLDVDQKLQIVSLHLQLSIARSLHEMNVIGVSVFNEPG